MHGKLAALSAVVLYALIGQAQATLLSCPDTFTEDGTAKVTFTGNTNTAASHCEYIDPPNPSNVANLDTINQEGFFGSTNWVDNNQTEIDTNNQSSGAWVITNVDFTNRDYIIVFKDGQNTNLTAFLFNGLTAAGNWYTPFTNPPFEVGNPKDVSHYTIAFRSVVPPPPPPQQIPEPGTLALVLFGLALTGSAAMRRRQRSQ